MSTPDNDEFDDRVLTEMSRMFTEMGMPIDIEVLKKMMRQVREQFETMGIDPEKMASSKIRMGIDSDPEEFRKNMESLLNGPGGMADLFRNMGINVQFEGASSNEPVAEVEVDVEASFVSIFPARAVAMTALLSDLSAASREISANCSSASSSAIL